MPENMPNRSMLPAPNIFNMLLDSLARIFFVCHLLSNWFSASSTTSTFQMLTTAFHLL